MSPAQADALYLRRFVTIGGVAVETARVRSQVDASGATESVLENPTGVVQSLLPPDADADAFLEGGDGARFGNRLKLTRIGNTPVLAFIRGEGSYQVPTPPLSGAVLLQINARPVTANGGPASVVAGVQFIARENIGAAAWGSSMRVQAGRVGAGISDSLADFQSGGAGVAELVSLPATFRMVPGATAFVVRDSANTLDGSSFSANGGTVSLAQLASGSLVNVGSSAPTGSATLAIRGAAGQLSDVQLYSGNVARWILRRGALAETGANAGSPFQLIARDDAGANIGNVFEVVRAQNGAITVGDPAGARQVIIAGTAFGAGVASLRFNGLTNGAGAAAGTLLNAPAAGNPAFWLPVSIAGTVRYIPCW